MPPRRAQPTQGTQATQGTQQQNDDGAGPSNQPAFPDYVTMTLAQAIMAEGFMPEADFKAMVRRLLKVNTDNMFLRVLGSLQREIQFLDIGVERIRLPANDSWYICLVDKERDDASKQMGSKYGAEVVAFARAVVEAIASAAPREGRLLGELSQIQLLNLDVQRTAAAAAGADAGGTQAAAAAGTQGGGGGGARGRKLGGQERGNALRALEADGWLHEARPGYFTLGPRTIGELKDLVLDLVPEEVATTLRNDYM